MEHAARLLLSEGYEPDIIYTSRLTRAVKSTWAVLNELNAPYLPVYKSWRLNERNYGALTGLKKMDAAKELGVEVVQAWRNSLKARPPPMKKDDTYYPGKDRRYEDLSEEQIPLTESLMDCMERARPLFEYGIRKELERGNTVLVVAHTNTLRGLMKVIDGELLLCLCGEYEFVLVLCILWSKSLTLDSLPYLSQTLTTMMFKKSPCLPASHSCTNSIPT